MTVITGKELTKMALEYRNPPAFPILQFNRHYERGDVVIADCLPAAAFKSDMPGMTEWGFAWEHVDGTMGQPKSHPIGDYSDLETYVFPDPAAAGRLDRVAQMRQEYPDKFLIASLGISGFTHVTFLRGFENTLMDLCADPENILALTDRVMAFEDGLTRRFAQAGADAVGFADDWGTQNALMISPDLWRRYFKPRYARQFKLAHEWGLSVFFHCCGNILDIMPDLIEIGADIINLNQPDIFGIEELAARFAGRICLCCPVDHQTTAIHGSDEEIDRYIKRMKASFTKNGGGFMGYIEYYPSLGMSERTYRVLEDRFYSNKRYT